MIDAPYELVIVALLPLTAILLVTQVNPYYALIIRGILGAVAALVYALLGAADVALTEALVGTMLSITLYVVAVRSSLSLRVGIVDGLGCPPGAEGIYHPEPPPTLEPLLPDLKQVLKQHHMRLELVGYMTAEAMEAAIAAKEIHAVYQPPQASDRAAGETGLAVRTPQLYNMLQSELPAQIKLYSAETTAPASLEVTS
ncbi:MAG: hydrogenase subunit MbhD domain-containing protein [Cyanobacteria bacterium P01_A01_bin.135]